LIRAQKFQKQSDNAILLGTKKYPELLTWDRDVFKSNSTTDEMTAKRTVLKSFCKDFLKSTEKHFLGYALLLLGFSLSKSQKEAFNKLGMKGS